MTLIRQEPTVKGFPRYHELDADVVGHWKLNGNGDDETGTYDIAGGGSEVWAPGVIPGTLAYVADSGDLSRPSNDPAIGTTGALTMMAMVKAYSSSAGAVTTFSGGASDVAANNILHSMRLTGGVWRYVVEFGAGTNVDVSSNSNGLLQHWQHVALTRNAAGTAVKMFINDVKILDQTGLNAPDGGSTSTFKIASSWDGLVQSVIMRDVEWSDAQIIAEARKVMGL